MHAHRMALTKLTWRLAGRDFSQTLDTWPAKFLHRISAFRNYNSEYSHSLICSCRWEVHCYLYIYLINNASIGNCGMPYDYVDILEFPGAHGQSMHSIKQQSNQINYLINLQLSWNLYFEVSTDLRGFLQRKSTCFRLRTILLY